MIDAKVLLKKLSNAVSLGYMEEAADIAEEYLKDFAEVHRNGNTVTATVKGKSPYKLLLDAHVDEIGFVVTNVDEKGFVTVGKAGGIDPRILPTKILDIHSKEKVSAVFCSTPPHLSKGEVKYESVSDIKLDTLLGEKAKDIISVGDVATFHSASKELLGGRISGKSLDNRAGVTALILLTEKISKLNLPFSVVILLSDQEELGLRGARTSAFKETPDEAIVIDVSFGLSPDCSAQDCGELSAGGMIGISPCLDKKISDRLITVAKENNIPYQTEVMGGATGTNADVISITKSGVPTGLLSIPLRFMHTDIEVVDIKDIEDTAELLFKYIVSKGGDFE